MPVVERRALRKLGIDETGSGIVAPGIDDALVWECADGRVIPIEEHSTVFSTYYVTSLCEEYYDFDRIRIPGYPKWIYVFDASMAADTMVLMGVGDQSDETVVKMFMRIADHDKSRMPSRISVSAGTDLSKTALLDPWKNRGFYRDYPAEFQDDYLLCEYSSCEA